MSSTKPTCRMVRAEGAYAGKQGLTYRAGIAAETVGSSGICMHLLTVPPGARAKAHLHENHETTVYVLSGTVLTVFGQALEQFFVSGPGDLVYIPAGVPHLPVNMGPDPATAVIARTDPNEQESVVLRPDLEAMAQATIDRARAELGL